MQTLIVDNKEKGFKLTIEYDQAGVRNSLISYTIPVPLSKFINCGAIAKTNDCSSPQYEMYPSDENGNRL